MISDDENDLAGAIGDSEILENSAPAKSSDNSKGLAKDNE